MTPRHLQLLTFIDDYQRRTGVIPSYAEMTAAMGLTSKGGVSQMLTILERAGRIRRPNVKGAARGLTILIPPPRPKLVCPHCGGSFTPT